MQGHGFDLPLGQLSLEEKLHFHPGRLPSSLLLLNDSWVTRQTDRLRMEKPSRPQLLMRGSQLRSLCVQAQGVWVAGAAKQRTAPPHSQPGRTTPPLGAGAAGRLSGAGGEKLTSPDLASGLGFIKPIALSLVSLLGLALNCISGPRFHLDEQLLIHGGLPTISVSLG